MRSILAFVIFTASVVNPVLAQDPEIAKLNEVEAQGHTKQQTDLDTYKLASAHRERAKSLEEKTNGLYQSWLVSICQGCGMDVRPAARDLKNKDFPMRDVPLTTGASESKTKKPENAEHAAASGRRERHTSIAADLSPGNVDAIRRQPRQ